MVSIRSDQLQQVVASVADWPAHDRILLARKILETVEQPRPPQTHGLRAEEVLALLKTPQPAPSDEECDQIVEQARLARYGR